MSKITIRPAGSDDEIRKVFEIRREVFVVEQNLFADTDRDGDDLRSLYLIALMDGEITGVVRVFPTSDHAWVGGRLAVRKKYRGTRVGYLLVKGAMRLVKEKRCSSFTAMIQEENINFFKRIGWRPFGEILIYHGKRHVWMEADLSTGEATNKTQARVRRPDPSLTGPLPLPGLQPMRNGNHHAQRT